MILVWGGSRSSDDVQRRDRPEAQQGGKADHVPLFAAVVMFTCTRSGRVARRARPARARPVTSVLPRGRSKSASRFPAASAAAKAHPWLRAACARIARQMAEKLCRVGLGTAVDVAVDDDRQPNLLHVADVSDLLGRRDSGKLRATISAARCRGPRSSQRRSERGWSVMPAICPRPEAPFPARAPVAGTSRAERPAAGAGRWGRRRHSFARDRASASDLDGRGGRFVKTLSSAVARKPIEKGCKT